MKNLLLQKVHLVLEAVASHGSITINELAEKFAIPLPTMSRLISDMTEMKLLERLDYYHVAPATGLIRLGECARKSSLLVKKVVPILERFAEKMQMNLLLSGFDEETMFTIFHRGMAGNSNLIWESGLALVLMKQAKLPQESCLELFSRNVPGASDTELLVLMRELEEIDKEQMLFRTNTMRQWSCSCGFTCRGIACGFCFYGQAPECSRERFVLECSRVLSRINAIFNEE